MLSSQSVKHLTSAIAIQSSKTARVILYFIVCATIEERTINPTDEQAQACLRVCQMLSSYYRDIQLFRFNAQTREVYIFAGDELQIIVSRNGLWRFVDETEL